LDRIYVDLCCLKRPFDDSGRNAYVEKQRQ
jgi:hypothetical protein